MKKIFTFVFALMMCNAIFGQYHLIPFPEANTNPKGLNTDDELPVGGGIPGGWTTALSPGATPKWSASRTIPFSFSFNNEVVTNFKVSNSGVLTFDVTSTKPAPAFKALALPDTTVPNKSICILGLGGVGTNDNVITKTFGKAPNRQFWIQFNSYGYGTTPSDGTNYCYWSMVLEETTNAIYIVDNRSNGYTGKDFVSAGIQFDATSALVVEGSPALEPLSSSDPSPADNSYYSFRPGEQPKYDISLESISTKAFLVKGGNKIKGSFKNYGTETITSFDFNYQVAGSSAVTETIKNLNIPTYETTEVEHPTVWTSVAGTYNVTVWISNINGNSDGDSTNNYGSKKLVVVSKEVQRLPFFEIFTSSTCPPCKPGNENLHSIIDKQPAEDYVVVKYQQDFPGTGDPYTTNETVARRNVYAINSVPRMEIDGGWDGNANAFSDDLYNQSRDVFAQYELKGSYYVDAATKKVQAKVYYAPLYNAPAQGTRLYVAVLERLTTKNIKTNGETEFTDVVKKILPNDKGTLITNAMTEEAWDTVRLSYQFNGNYRLPADGTASKRIKLDTEHSVEEFTDLRVVAWLQSTGTDKQVYQAFNLTEDKTIDAKDANVLVEGVKTFPNPVANVLNVSMTAKQADKVTLLLISSDGKVNQAIEKQVVEGNNLIQINTADMPNGTYFLSIIDAGNNSHTEAVVIMK
jgi:hypothetical protein